jgi:hypothetical protein
MIRREEDGVLEETSPHLKYPLRSKETVHLQESLIVEVLGWPRLAPVFFFYESFFVYLINLKYLLETVY